MRYEGWCLGLKFLQYVVLFFSLVPEKVTEKKINFFIGYLKNLYILHTNFYVNQITAAKNQAYYYR